MSPSEPSPGSFAEQADPAVARAKYLACQRQARTLGRTTASIQTLYALECFLRRLTMTDYASHFLLKGGVLLAAYDVRRPTKDVDMQVVDHPLDADYLRRVVHAVAAVQVSDGMTYLSDDITIDAIREGTDDLYVGHRVRFDATLASARLRMQLDISTGDPVSPAPALVTIPGILPGEQLTIMGHPLGNVIAEKTITMLQRGAANTRWRDFLDVYALSCRQSFVADTVRESLERVAASRQVRLETIGGLAEEFDAQAQAKYARWRGDLAMDQAARDDLCKPLLSDQVRAVAAFIDPVMIGSIAGETWNPAVQRWT
ncbi:nucleotidyl transferase AbiEii/AbiGii toxin family protein [Kineococcus rubinsiae]|uniref:nucleotidyl transferase AbiEii/AbiGii toxin family protein n=1 Tax=Kineococcus rubinsiae TaxID=2609562 RepID=UPI00143003FF|nr:nucleotidyl transferase AbiEii/AbiGii toxin family protein [Kineococcus rubinsiae]NIZ90295.1 nucleotidyl transferase AbiEii/AbiGii toxin family protein [Kineococcus rubinsiae]